MASDVARILRVQVTRRLQPPQQLGEYRTLALCELAIRFYRQENQTEDQPSFHIQHIDTVDGSVLRTYQGDLFIRRLAAAGIAYRDIRPGDIVETPHNIIGAKTGRMQVMAIDLQLESLILAGFSRNGRRIARFTPGLATIHGLRLLYRPRDPWNVPPDQTLITFREIDAGAYFITAGDIFRKTPGEGSGSGNAINTDTGQPRSIEPEQTVSPVDPTSVHERLMLCDLCLASKPATEIAIFTPPQGGDNIRRFCPEHFEAGQ